MSRGRHNLLILLMMFVLAATAGAQQTESAATATATPPATATPEEQKAAAREAADIAADKEEGRRYAVRDQFTKLVTSHRWQLGQALALEPTLLRNREFIATYPELERFIGEHPEVSKDVHFYMQEIGTPRATASAVDQALEAIAIVCVTLLAVFALTWLVRTIIEQRRWSRLSKQQAEVHNKILDRFGSSEEVLQYIKSPAGSKFLESAPIPVRVEPAFQNAPAMRIMWAIQIGIIVAIAAFGMILVSFRLEKDAALALFTMGAIGFCVGAGFIASAFVSVVVSRRLGLWQGSPESPSGLDDVGGVR